MKIRVGILGLPNVGKSTLFNALAQQSIAQAANFPFCTIEPNTAPIAVPDKYLFSLGRWATSTRTVPCTMEWIDVAGLVQGAHRGEGLGNRFLGTLRECEALCHVVRLFEDADISRVVVDQEEGTHDPVTDIEVVQLELLLADLQHAQRRLDKTSCVGAERAALERVVEGLESGLPARAVGLEAEELVLLKSMGLLTLKPVLYALNVDEVDFWYARQETLERAREILNQVAYGGDSQHLLTLVSAKAETQLAESQDDKEAYLESLGIELEELLESGQVWEDLLSFRALPAAIRQLLDLSIVYTGPGVPPERSRTTKAYLVVQASGMTAHDLAGRLHGDIQRGFMRAEVASAATLLEYPNYAAAKESGKVRLEGKDYVLQSDDVVLVKWK